jgi:hypothetical protein
MSDISNNCSVRQKMRSESNLLLPATKGVILAKGGQASIVFSMHIRPEPVTLCPVPTAKKKSLFARYGCLTLAPSARKKSL